MRFGFKNLYNPRIPPTFWFPLPYSTRIQNNVPKKDNAEAHFRSWHFPVSRQASNASELEGADSAAVTNSGEGLHEFDWYCLKYKIMNKVSQELE